MAFDDTAPEPGHWQVLSASVIGAAHLAKGVPQQDAVSVAPPAASSGPAGPLSVAVADGHGHHRHFRSRRGAEMAVRVAVDVATSRAPEVAAGDDLDQVANVGRTVLAPEILAAWQAAVTADLEASPVTDRELVAAGVSSEEADDDPVFSYGTTLMLALIAGRWVLCLQIGDGDILAIDSTGGTRTPMPVDPRLDGLRTTSLCQADALTSFRVAVVDQQNEPLCAVLLATDGYGNAQVDDPWQPGVGEDIHRFLHEHGIDWVGSNLGEWVARCASSEGSADDTTVALIVGPEAHLPPDPSAIETRAVKSPAQDAPLAPARSTAAAPTAGRATAASAVAIVDIDARPTLPPRPAPAAFPSAKTGTTLRPPDPRPERSPSPAPAVRRVPLLAAGAVLVAVIAGAVTWALAGANGKGTQTATAPPTVSSSPAPQATTGDRSTGQGPVLHDNATITDVNGAVLALPPGMASRAVIEYIQAGRFVVVLAADGRLYRLTPGQNPVSSPRLNAPGRGLLALPGALVSVPGQGGAVTYTVDLATMTASCRPVTDEGAARCSTMLLDGGSSP